MLPAVIFGLGKNVLASCNDLVITSVANPTSSSEKDFQFVKLQNSSSDDWIFETGKTYLGKIRLVIDGKNHYITLSPGIDKIFGKEYFIITNSKDFDAFRKHHSLDEKIKLFHSSFELEDAGFAELSCDSGKNPFGKFIFEKKEEPASAPKIYSDKIYLNELLPKPIKDSGQEEFAEIYNSSSAEEKLDGWKLQDRAKYVCDLSGLSVKAAGFLTIKASEIKKLGNKCTITLNDTKGEEISLLNPDGKIISSVAYSGTAKENYSYSFDGEKWKWTEFLTPGEENEFADYSGKIRIVSLVPNPKGKDDKEWLEIKNGTKKEINFKNWSIATGWKKLSNHPIREDFKIKPGKTKKLTKKICAFTLNNMKNKLELRDPLGEVVQKIKYDKKKDKMEEDEVYKINGKKWSWDNSASPVSSKKISTKKASAFIANVSNSTTAPLAPALSEEELQNQKLDREVEENADKFTPVPEEENDENSDEPEDFSKIKTPNNLALNNLAPKFSPERGRVLGAFDMRETEKQYLFTPATEQKHWAKNLINSFWQEINFRINKTLLNFF